mgnify:CR=1 FL=1
MSMKRTGKSWAWRGWPANILSVRARRTNRHMRPRAPVLLTKLFAGPVYNRRARRTANLHVE